MLDQTWRLSGSVALRPEPFGALAYNFSTRQLSFLKTPQLVAVVRGLGPATTVEQALLDADVDRTEWISYLRALRGLASTGMIERTTGTVEHQDAS